MEGTNIEAAVNSVEGDARRLFEVLADTPFDSWRRWLVNKHRADSSSSGDGSVWIKSVRSLPIIQKTRQMAISYEKYGSELMKKAKKAQRSYEERKKMADEWFSAWSEWFFDLGFEGEGCANNVHEGVLMYVVLVN